MQPSAFRPAHARERLLERLAGHVSRRDPPDDRLRNERQRPDDRRVERLHAARGGRSAREARAKHHAVMTLAPASARRREHSRAVAPEVATSSTRSRRRGRRPRDPERAAHVGRAPADRKPALDLGLAALYEAAPGERKSEARREGDGQGLGGVIAARPPRAEGRGDADDLVGRRHRQRLGHDPGESRRDVVGPAELEGEQDLARRADDRAPPRGASRTPAGPAGSGRSAACPPSRPAASRRTARTAGAPRGGSALQHASQIPPSRNRSTRRIRQARQSRRQNEAGRGPCELEQLFSGLSDSRTTSVESKRRDCSLSCRPGSDRVERGGGAIEDRAESAVPVRRRCGPFGGGRRPDLRHRRSRRDRERRRQRRGVLGLQVGRRERLVRVPDGKKHDAAADVRLDVDPAVDSRNPSWRLRAGP